MKGIKVGNILLYRGTTVCVISEIITNGDDTAPCIVGIDGKNTKYTGTPDDWGSVLNHKDKLYVFENLILNNIVHSRGL